MAEVSEEFRKHMTELVELKKQVTEARKDLKVLTDREKVIKKFIQSEMSQKKIDTINLRKGKVSLKTSMKKPSYTKKTVETGLTTFFQGDSAKVEGAINCIVDATPSVETSTLSLTGINKD